MHTLFYGQPTPIYIYIWCVAKENNCTEDQAHNNLDRFSRNYLLFRCVQTAYTYINPTHCKYSHTCKPNRKRTNSEKQCLEYYGDTNSNTIWRTKSIDRFHKYCLRMLWLHLAAHHLNSFWVNCEFTISRRVPFILLSSATYLLRSAHTHPMYF